ncbi:RNA polymerase sigma factor [Fulvivirgaceae bacterium BMA10]|uniref:RNA polymerase sigma factor n=1 Tax=Splendidivirga corallicola TaxID=3051826 RepID=A0ABT8KN86_9BACT|nr:RNA polymerase sigma factor [Fulvivirgaceae bacterium BMA10]
MNIAFDMFSPLKKNVSTGTKVDPKQPKLNRSPEADKSLWKAFTKGSEAAFVDIYNQHFQILYDYGRQFSGDFEFVKDCIQEVFISIRTKRSKLPLVSSIKAYLLKAVRNKILTEIRDTRKNQFTDINTLPLNFHVVPSYENVLINRQFNDDQISQIQKSLSLLSERQREAIYHFYYANLGYHEIRDIMGFGSTRAARNLVYRAISEIRRALNKPDRW